MTQTIEPYIKPFMKIWFWLLILSIAGFIIYAVFFESQKDSFDGDTVPSWTWLMLIMSIFMLIVSFVLYRLDIAAYTKRKALAIACGDIPAEPPKPVLQCPKKEPIQKIICKQTKPLPCSNSNTEQHIYYKNTNQPIQVSPPLNVSQMSSSMTSPPLNVSQMSSPPLNVSQMSSPMSSPPLNVSQMSSPMSSPPLNVSPKIDNTENLIPPGRG
jgi:hypothetical protein